MTPFLQLAMQSNALSQAFASHKVKIVIPNGVREVRNLCSFLVPDRAAKTYSLPHLHQSCHPEQCAFCAAKVHPAARGNLNVYFKRHRHPTEAQNA